VTRPLAMEHAGADAEYVSPTGSRLPLASHSAMSRWYFCSVSGRPHTPRYRRRPSISTKT
ncbi:MAG: hypothetical protein ACIAXF_06905, partial [Phycisphaerales bacterium JB063]